ncbi:MAG: transposase family protein [Spiroplasma phoeniceum]|nr:MAG: transposase family protein [Spiroplasma phoeniceum]UZQ32866.1 MAG: transposase family protein [Spiroplasma phoeniceum]
MATTSENAITANPPPHIIRITNNDFPIPSMPIKEKFKVLFTDVAYLILNGKKHYQSTILDGYTKEIVDVQWSKNNDNKIVINTFLLILTKLGTVYSLFGNN